jgi:RHS repeat-associated protein
MVANRYDYTAFGQAAPAGIHTAAHEAQQTVDQRYTYTGREATQDPGLMYYRYRMYAPGVGRFVSRDPLGYDGGIGLYSYCSNTPILYTDSHGLQESRSTHTFNIEWLGNTVADVEYQVAWTDCPEGDVWADSWKMTKDPDAYGLDATDVLETSGLQYGNFALISLFNMEYYLDGKIRPKSKESCTMDDGTEGERYVRNVEFTVEYEAHFFNIGGWSLASPDSWLPNALGSQSNFGGTMGSETRRIWGPCCCPLD